MRSLLVEYPRLDVEDNVLAILFDIQKVAMQVDLPVLSSDNRGIELKFPEWLSGIFYVKIQDGEQSFMKKIAIQ